MADKTPPAEPTPAGFNAPSPFFIVTPDEPAPKADKASAEDKAADDKPAGGA